MLTLTLQCEVPKERTLTVQLPDSVEPGLHELVMVLAPSSPSPAPDQAASIMKLAGSVPSFAAVDGVAWQRTQRDEWS